MEPRNIGLIVMGPQGSGKDELARNLNRRGLGFACVNTGDMIRERQRRDAGFNEAIGRRVDEGHRAPDELVSDLVKETIKGNPGRNMLFNGFPRTKGQAAFLIQTLALQGIQPYTVFLERLTFEICRERIFSGRNNRGERKDDTPEAFQRRWDLTAAQSKAIADYLKDYSTWFEVDGRLAPGEICDVVEGYLPLVSAGR